MLLLIDIYWKKIIFFEEIFWIFLGPIQTFFSFLPAEFSRFGAYLLKNIVMKIFTIKYMYVS